MDGRRLYGDVSQFMCQSTDRSDSDLRDCDTGVEELDHICVPAAAYAWEGGGGDFARGPHHPAASSMMHHWHCHQASSQSALHGATRQHRAQRATASDGERSGDGCSALRLWCTVGSGVGSGDVKPRALKPHPVPIKFALSVLATIEPPPSRARDGVPPAGAQLPPPTYASSSGPASAVASALPSSSPNSFTYRVRRKP